MAVKTIPQLPSRDFDETSVFYSSLGFVERSRWPNEYLILERPADGIEFHFWFCDTLDPKTNDFSCYVRWDSADEASNLYQEWTSAGLSAEHLRPPVETDYGLLEFALVDPQANLVRVGGSLPG